MPIATRQGWVLLQPTILQWFMDIFSGARGDQANLWDDDQSLLDVAAWENFLQLQTLPLWYDQCALCMTGDAKKSGCLSHTQNHSFCTTVSFQANILTCEVTRVPSEANQDLSFWFPGRLVDCSLLFQCNHSIASEEGCNHWKVLVLTPSKKRNGNLRMCKGGLETNLDMSELL